MHQDERNIHPESLFEIVVHFVSINAESLLSLTGFPEVVGKKIFDQFILLNEYAICPSNQQAKILSCFQDAYGELILESIDLSNSLIVFNEYFDSFTVLFQSICELCLCFCSLGDSHEIFQHFHNFCLLKKLCLKRNCLKDAAIRKITLPIRMFNKGPKNLEYLDLSDNMFTDESIPGLLVFKKLQRLDLSGSNLSNKGIQDLERNCYLKLSHSENNIHPIVTKGGAMPLVQKWHDVCLLRRKNRDMMKQNLYYSKKRFLLAKESISDSARSIQFNTVKLIFKRRTHIEETVLEKSAQTITSKSLPEKASPSYQKAIEDDLFAQYF